MPESRIVALQGFGSLTGKSDNIVGRRYQILLFCRVPFNFIIGFIIRTYITGGYGSLR